MARNLNNDIDWLERCATEMLDKNRNAESAQFQRIATTSRKLRDTLISVALSSGLASNEARDALAEMGLCCHDAQIFRVEVEVDIEKQVQGACVESWRCPGCGQSGVEQMEPYS